MSPEDQRETFTNALHEWLEANGVTFERPLSEPPFLARIDLNKLKVGMSMLIAAFGGGV